MLAYARQRFSCAAHLSKQGRKGVQNMNLIINLNAEWGKPATFEGEGARPKGFILVALWNRMDVKSIAAPRKSYHLVQKKAGYSRNKHCAL